jgi:hypothetical protein
MIDEALSSAERGNILIFLSYQKSGKLKKKLKKEK